MPDTTTSSAFIPEIWLATALWRLKSYLTLQRTVTMNTDLPTGESFAVGKTLHLPKRGSLVVNQKTENGNYTIQNPQADTVDLTLTHHPEVSFALTSEVIAFQNQDQSIGYVEDAIIALAEDVDTSLYQAAGLIAASNTVTNSGTITEPNILSARKILRDNKIAPNARAFGVVSTSQEAAILQLTNLVRYDAIGVTNNVSNATIGDGTIIMPGAIGRAYGFEVCPSQLVPYLASSTTTNALQSITVTGAPTGGSYTLTWNSLTTVPIAYNALAADVQRALSGLAGLAGSVFVSGADATGVGPFSVSLTGSAIKAITATASLTGGTTPGVTIAQVATTAGSKNLFYTQDFILMASRALPLPQPGTGALGTVMTDPDTGITMRLVKSWNPNIGSEQITVDLLYGFAAMRPEHGVLVQTS